MGRYPEGECHIRLEVHVNREIIESQFRYRSFNELCPVAFAVAPLLKRKWSVGGSAELYNYEDNSEYHPIEGTKGFEALMAAVTKEEVDPFTIVYDVPEEILAT